MTAFSKAWGVVKDRLNESGSYYKKCGRCKKHTHIEELAMNFGVCDGCDQEPRSAGDCEECGGILDEDGTCDAGFGNKLNDTSAERMKLHGFCSQCGDEGCTKRACQ